METDLSPRPAAASRVTLSIIIMPGQANPYGTMHGGVMLRLADECGAIAARRHVGHGQITTAAMDSMIFLDPVQIGERVEVTAEVTYAGKVFARVSHRDLRGGSGEDRPVKGRRRLWTRRRR